MEQQNNNDEEVKLEPWREPSFSERPTIKASIDIFKMLALVTTLSVITYFVGRSLI